jgi:hypothetical protein
MRIQLGLLLLAATQLGATDCGEVIRDAGFDLWCGDELCTWKLVRGDVRRVDTWHAGDSGVELLGEDAAISQLTPVNYSDGTCLELDFVANVEPNAAAQLRIDIYGDGTIDKEEPIPMSNWKALTYHVRLAKPFTGIRFELAKQGAGAAAFANIGARMVEDGCAGLPEVSGGPGPTGAYCLEPTDCESGFCRTVRDDGALFGLSRRCTGCDETSCGPGEVCGRAAPISPNLAVPIRCEPAGDSALGDQCVIDGECATGICANGACSTCSDQVPCANGAYCSVAWGNGPFVCEQGLGFRQTGEPCATNADCTSGTCLGEVRKACQADGRTCGNDTNCPVEAHLEHSPCIVVGITGGTCQ